MTNQEQYEKMIIPIRCKDCKYYREDFWGDVYGIPVIVAHQVCIKWGHGGCKTTEDGYCHFGELRGKE